MFVFVHSWFVFVYYACMCRWLISSLTSSAAHEDRSLQRYDVRPLACCLMRVAIHHGLRAHYQACHVSKRQVLVIQITLPDINLFHRHDVTDVLAVHAYVNESATAAARTIVRDIWTQDQASHCCAAALCPRSKTVQDKIKGGDTILQFTRKPETSSTFGRKRRHQLAAVTWPITFWLIG